MIRYFPHFWVIIIPCLVAIFSLLFILLVGISTHNPIDGVTLAQIQLSQEAYRRIFNQTRLSPYTHYDLKLLTVCPGSIIGNDLPLGKDMTEIIPVVEGTRLCMKHSLNFLFDAQETFLLPALKSC